MSRLRDLSRFYDLLGALRIQLGGFLYLQECNGRQDWPNRGVYFFLDEGEPRVDSETGPRVIRVGTHALKSGSRTTLWQRLSQHAGSSKSGAGNHRGSIFRLLVGEALRARENAEAPKSWGIGSDPGQAAERLHTTSAEVRAGEQDLEIAVSGYVGQLPFLVLGVEDDSGPESLRGVIERNSIALLSNFGKPSLDPPSNRWLGTFSGRERVRESGLWNNNHVDENYDPSFLYVLEQAIKETKPMSKREQAHN